MNRVTSLTHEFVEFIPNDLKEGVIYISIPYATAAHKCCCGCGNEVVTPLSKTDWKLIYDGETVSLSPSIGNWSFACQSHYWVYRNQVMWASTWSRNEISETRAYDQLRKEKYYNDGRILDDLNVSPDGVKGGEKQSYWKKVRKWFFRG